LKSLKYLYGLIIIELKLFSPFPARIIPVFGQSQAVCSCSCPNDPNIHYKNLEYCFTVENKTQPINLSMGFSVPHNHFITKFCPLAQQHERECRSIHISRYRTPLATKFAGLNGG
jgi:hypothetical protein